MKRTAFLLIMLSLLLLACGCATIFRERYKIEYIAGEGGFIDGDESQSVLISEDGTATSSSVTAVANSGYEFDSWSDGYKSPTRQDVVQGDKSFTAVFKKLPNVYIKYEVTEGGKIVGNKTQGAENGFTTSKVSAVASDGYRFVGWDDGLSSSERTDVANESKTYTAIFKKVHLITFSCDLDKGIVMGSEKQYVLDGNEISTVTAIARIGYKFSHWSNGDGGEVYSFTPTDSEEIEAVFVKEALSFPILSINTENGSEITSTSEYLSCTVSVENAPTNYCFSSSKAQIKGRGNSTWEYDKKPYKIKFDSSRDMFGAGKSKDWVLLTNHSDLSLSRNYLAQSIASLFDTINSTTGVQFVDLYVNGEYYGVYLLCEQIEVRQNKIDISEDEGVDTGYLIELDSRKDGTYITIEDEYYVIKSPETLDPELKALYKEFISGYLEDCIEALKSGDYEAVCELMDPESFAEAYIVYELFNCVDVGYASFNMYKDKGDRLCCGPVWDFDRSLGLVGNNKGAKKYDTLWAKEQNPWFNYLLQYDEFKELVSSKLIGKSDEITEKLGECYDYLYTSRDSIDRNFQKWRILGTFVWPNDDELIALDTWEKQIEYTRTYLYNSLNFLLDEYAIE